MLNNNIYAEINEIHSPLSPESLSNLKNYLKLLEKWSKVHNLVSTNSSNNLLELVMDCKPLITKAIGIDGSVADLGSGAGLPGMLLAIIQPDRLVYLIDSEASKCSFLQQVKIELSLKNVLVIHRRVEEWKPKELPKLICSRGLARLDRLAKMCKNIVTPGTMILVLKSRDPDNEIAKLKKLKFWKITASSTIASKPSRYLIEAMVQ